jgi:hypothetical protein
MEGAHHFVVHQYRAPKKETYTVDDIVVMNLTSHDGNTVLECDSFHKGGRIFKNIKLENGEKAVITSIKLLWCANGSNREVHFEIHDLFALREGQASLHPEVSGVVKLIIPPRHVGSVPLHAQRVFQANFLNIENVTLLHYLGMEDAILNARSSVIPPDMNAFDSSTHHPNFQIFCRTDPLLVFILDHKKLWKGDQSIRPQDIVQCKSNPKYYRVSKRVVKQAQHDFRCSIFPNFCYTHPEHKMHLVWDKQMEGPPEIPPHLVERKEEEEQITGLGLIVFRLEIEYILITNEFQSFFLEEINLL